MPSVVITFLYILSVLIVATTALESFSFDSASSSIVPSSTSMSVAVPTVSTCGCDATDVTCIAKCHGSAAPSSQEANATNTCVAGCIGSNSKSNSACVQQCIQNNYLANTTTSIAKPSMTAVSPNTSNITSIHGNSTNGTLVPNAMSSATHQADHLVVVLGIMSALVLMLSHLQLILIVITDSTITTDTATYLASLHSSNVLQHPRRPSSRSRSRSNTPSAPLKPAEQDAPTAPAGPAEQVEQEAKVDDSQVELLQRRERKDLDKTNSKTSASASVDSVPMNETSAILKQLATIRRSNPALIRNNAKGKMATTEERNVLRKSTLSLPSPPFVETDEDNTMNDGNDDEMEAMTSEMISAPRDQGSTFTLEENVPIDSMSVTSTAINDSSTPNIQCTPPKVVSSIDIDSNMSHPDPALTSPYGWSIDNVITWLSTTFNITDTAVLEAFRDNDIDGHILLTAVNDTALKGDLKVKSFGKRARILQAISKLRDGAANGQELSSSEDEIQHSPRKRKDRSRSGSGSGNVRPSKRRQHGPIRRMDIHESKDELVQEPDGNDGFNNRHRLDTHNPHLEVVIDRMQSQADSTSDSSRGIKRKRAVLSTLPLPDVASADAHGISSTPENITGSSSASQKPSSRRQLPDPLLNDATKFKVVKGLLPQPDTTDTNSEQIPRISQAISDHSISESPQGYSWAGLLQKYMDMPPGEVLPVYGESDEEMADSELEREMEEDVIAELERAERLQRKRELKQARRQSIDSHHPGDEDAGNNLNVETQLEGEVMDVPEVASKHHEHIETPASDADSDTSHLEIDKEIADQVPRLQSIRQTRVNHTSMGDISAEEARSILDECISSYRQDWFVDRLPREEAQAHRIRERESGRDFDLKAELDHLKSVRLPDQKEAILANDFNSENEILKQAKALEPTVHSICRLEWVLELISMPQPQPPPKTGSSKADSLSSHNVPLIQDGDDDMQSDTSEQERHDQLPQVPDDEIEPEEDESEHPDENHGDDDDDDDDDDMADFIVDDDDGDENGIADPPLTARDRIIDKARATRRVSSDSSKDEADSKSPHRGTTKSPADTHAETRLSPSTRQQLKPRMIAKKTVRRKQALRVSISSDDELPSIHNPSQYDNNMETDSDSPLPPANTVLERSIKKSNSIGSSSQQDTPTAKPRRSAMAIRTDELVESMLNDPSPELVAFITSGRKLETDEPVERDALRMLRDQYKTWSTTIRPPEDFLDAEDDPVQDVKAFARYYLSKDEITSPPVIPPSQGSQRSPPKNKSKALMLRPLARLSTSKSVSTPSNSSKGKERNDMDVVELSSDEEEEGSVAPSQMTVYKPLQPPKATKRRRHKKYAGPIEKSTKQAQERQKRQEKAIAQRIQKQQRAGQTFEMEGSVMINPGHKVGEEDVWVIPSLSKALKPHQIEGVKFLWKNIVMIGNGCILAHDMGLGKTLQVITFIVTLMREIAYNRPVPIGLKPARILILCPPSVVDNWCNEFQKWIPLGSELWDDGVRSVSKLNSPSHSSAYDREESRLDQLEAWYEAGGIFIMSYDKYKSYVLNSGKSRLSEDQMKRVNNYLVSPGPSAVICDEGHVLRNKDGKLLEAVRKMSTKSRICLTGYPVQNNLLEYWAMLDFAHPGYLGSDMSFQYRFVYPIRDGMYEDSTPQEKKTMHRKTFILNGIVGAKVNREDISVLKDILPSKTEYKIQVELADEQRELYNAAVQDMANRVAAGMSSTLFANADVVQAICNHPIQLAKKVNAHAKRYNYRVPERQLAIVAASSIDSPDSPANKDSTPEGTPTAENPDEMTYAWATEILQRIPDIQAATLSNKIVIAMNIIHECQRNGEKILFFCHTHAILDLMEQLLNAEPTLRYMRFDGKTVVNRRQSLISEFNTSENCSVFLLSTRATSLGVNIASASRVILFDINWNPSHEAQAIGRAYRLGQQKPVVVYRITTWGTFETKMSDQAELKQHLAARVVDQRNTKHSINRDATRYFVPVPPAPTYVESVEQSILDSIDDEDVKSTFYIDPVLLGAVQGRNDILTDVRVSEITNAPTFDFSEAELAAMLEEIERNKEGIYDDVHAQNDTAAAASQRQGSGTATGASVVIGGMMQYAANVLDQVLKNVNA